MEEGGVGEEGGIGEGGGEEDEGWEEDEGGRGEEEEERRLYSGEPCCMTVQMAMSCFD